MRYEGNRDIEIKSGIRLDDVRYIELYNEYSRLLAEGEKITYIVAALSDKYGVCERTVYDLIRRLKAECNLLAV